MMCIFTVQASYSQPDGGFFFGNIYCLQSLTADVEKACQLLFLHHSDFDLSLRKS
jgi:hypothetical protein